MEPFRYSFLDGSMGSMSDSMPIFETRAIGIPSHTNYMQIAQGLYSPIFYSPSPPYFDPQMHSTLTTSALTQRIDTVAQPWRPWVASEPVVEQQPMVVDPELIDTSNNIPGAPFVSPKPLNSTHESTANITPNLDISESPEEEN